MNQNEYLQGYVYGPTLPHDADIFYNVNAHMAGVWQAEEDRKARQAGVDQRAEQKRRDDISRAPERPAQQATAWQPSAEEQRQTDRRLAFVGWLAAAYFLGFFFWPLWVPCFLGIIAALFALCAPEVSTRLATWLDGKLQAIIARWQR